MYSASLLAFAFRHGSVKRSGTVGAVACRRSARARANGSNRSEGTHGWLRFLGQISHRDKCICQLWLMVSSVFLFVNRSYAMQSDAQRQKLRGSRFADIGSCGEPAICTTVVNIVWGLVVQRLVGAPAVVEVKILRQSSSQLRSGFVAMQVNIFVLYAAPFCGAPQNGAYVPRVVTWPTVPDAVDLPSMVEG